MSTTTKPEGFKYLTRQATATEIQGIGFKVEGEQAESPTTGAWYMLEDFVVSASATIDDVQHFGKFISLQPEGPCAERVLIEI